MPSIDPTQLTSVAAPGAAAGGARSGQPDGSAGGDFLRLLRDQLQEVNRMQNEAHRGVEGLVTGEAQNIAEVFTAARKAQVAFTLLMEIRNKLVDAYQELQQLRV